MNGSIEEQLQRLGIKGSEVAMSEKQYEKPGNRKFQSSRGYEPIEGKNLPKEYVEEAENVMVAFQKYNRSLNFSEKLTTSKIRNILSMATDVYNIENQRTDEKLTEDSLAKIKMMHVRILYEAGRDVKVVKEFVIKSKLLCYLKDIGDNRKKLINFTHYLEALVAYHRYFGGKD